MNVDVDDATLAHTSMTLVETEPSVFLIQGLVGTNKIIGHSLALLL